MREELAKVRAENKQLTEKLNSISSNKIHSEKGFESIQKDRLTVKSSKNQDDHSQFEAPKTHQVNVEHHEVKNDKRSFFEGILHLFRGPRNTSWLQVSSNLLFEQKLTAPYDSFGVDESDAFRNVVDYMKKSGTLISGIKGDKLTSLGVLDAECIKLPFACYQNNKEMFTRPLFAETCFVGLRFIYLRSIQNRLLTFEGDDSVDAKYQSMSKPGQGEWVLESIGENSVFFSHNSKSGRNVLAINDAGEVKLTTGRFRNSWEEFEVVYHKAEKVITIRRVRSPRYYLSCDDNGKVTGYLHFNLLGNEAWRID